MSVRPCSSSVAMLPEFESVVCLRSGLSTHLQKHGGDVRRDGWSVERLSNHFLFQLVLLGLGTGTDRKSINSSAELLFESAQKHTHTDSSRVSGHYYQTHCPSDPATSGRQLWLFPLHPSPTNLCNIIKKFFFDIDI